MFFIINSDWPLTSPIRSKNFSQKLTNLLTTKILINTDWFVAEMKCETQKLALKLGKKTIFFII